MDLQLNQGLLSDNVSHKKILDLLHSNSDKNFVKRMLNPDEYPVLADWNGPDTFGTHAISYVDGNDGAYIYPTIVQGDDGNLVLKRGRDAWDYAKTTGEYIKVPTRQDAEDFGKNYKKAAGWSDSTFNNMIKKAQEQRTRNNSGSIENILTGKDSFTKNNPVYNWLRGQ